MVLVSSHDFARKSAGILAIYAFSLITDQRVSMHLRAVKYRSDQQNIYYACSSKFFM